MTAEEVGYPGYPLYFLLQDLDDVAGYVQKRGWPGRARSVREARRRLSPSVTSAPEPHVFVPGRLYTRDTSICQCGRALTDPVHNQPAATVDEVATEKARERSWWTPAPDPTLYVVTEWIGVDLPELLGVFTGLDRAKEAGDRITHATWIHSDARPGLYGLPYECWTAESGAGLVEIARVPLDAMLRRP